MCARIAKALATQAQIDLGLRDCRIFEPAEVCLFSQLRVPIKVVVEGRTTRNRNNGFSLP